MLKDGWVLVLQRRGQAKFIISNSHPYNQIKHKGSNSVFPDVPPSPSRAEGSSPLPRRRSHKPPSLQIQLMFMHVAISIPPTWERQYPGSSHPTGLGDTQLAAHPSWSFSRQRRGDARLPCEHPGVGGYQRRAPPSTRNTAVVPRAGAADVCSQDARGKNTWLPAHNQPEPDPPEIIIVTSRRT